MLQCLAILPFRACRVVSLGLLRCASIRESPDRHTAWLGSLGISAAQQVTIMKREVHVPAQRDKMIGGHQLYRKPCYNDFR